MGKLKLLFGGGAGWLIALLVSIGLGLGGGLYLEYRSAVSQKLKAEAKVERLEGELGNYRNTLASLALQDKAQKEDARKQQETEDAINSVQDTDYCHRAPSIGVVFDRLRDEWVERNPSGNSSK